MELESTVTAWTKADTNGRSEARERINAAGWADDEWFRVTAVTLRLKHPECDICMRVWDWAGAPRVLHEEKL